MQELAAQLHSHLRGIWKYRWYAVVCAWVIALAGLTIVFKLPDRYEASARVYVDTQTILRPLLAGMTATLNIEQQVQIMSRTLLSRPNLEKVMRMVDLDLKAKTAKEKEKVLQELVENIKIASTGNADLYTIQFNNENPELAKNVVQSLLTLFVESGLSDKRQDSTSAIRFIEDQIKDYEEKLVAAENSLVAFKRKNYGQLPGEDSDYFAKLTQVSEQRDQAQLDLQEAENARDAIKQQLVDEESDVVEEATPVADSNPEIDARILELNKNLDNLRLRYTEQHPDITSTKRLIEQLQERKKEEAKQQKPGAASGGAAANPMQQQLSVVLTEAEARVASMKARVAEYSTRYDQLKSQINAVPQVQAEYTQLMRDYGVNKANYDKLLERRESAKMSGQMSETAQMVSFRIIDPPTTPQIPSAPNRLLLSSVAFLGGLLGGIGIAFLMYMFRPTFQSQGDLWEITGVPVLGTVGMVWTDQEKARQRRGVLALVLSLLIFLGLYATVMTTLQQTMEPFLYG